MSDSSAMSAKEKKWQEVREWLTHIDSLKPMDAGILELVTALGVLGMKTSGSCEGHLDHGDYAPFVIVYRDARLSARANKALREAQKQKKAGNLSAREIESLFSQARKYQEEAVAANFPDRKKALEYLSRFYDGRPVPNERRIILISRDYLSVLQNQGACLQEMMRPKERARRLAEYQQEMHDFAAFLKKQFFAG